MIPGYNTNGFAHHRIEDAFEILARIGYRSVALTLERDLLDPPDARGLAKARDRMERILARTPLALTIETGSRFLLDPWRKHQPTLVHSSENARRKRVDFLLAAIELAPSVNADAVSLWSGMPDDAPSESELWDRLLHALEPLIQHAQSLGVRLAFEPEPGMFVDTMDKFARLKRMMSCSALGLTLDVGHVHCLADGRLPEHIERWSDVLWNVHLADMRRGVHDHLMFGEGEIDFDTVFAALVEAGYAGPLHVELSRHSHDAVETARRAYEFLSPHLAGLKLERNP